MVSLKVRSLKPCLTVKESPEEEMNSPSNVFEPSALVQVRAKPELRSARDAMLMIRVFFFMISSIIRRESEDLFSNFAIFVFL